MLLILESSDPYFQSQNIEHVKVIYIKTINSFLHKFSKESFTFDNFADIAASIVKIEVKTQWNKLKTLTDAGHLGYIKGRVTYSRHLVYKLNLAVQEIAKTKRKQMSPLT